MLPKYPELLRQAMQFASAGQPQQAIHALETYLRQTPDDPRGWWGLANLTNDVALKQQYLVKVLTLSPQHEKARAMLHVLQKAATANAAHVVSTGDWLSADISPQDDLLQMQSPSSQDAVPPNDALSWGPSSKATLSPSTDAHSEPSPTNSRVRRTQPPRSLSTSQRTRAKGKHWLLIWGILALAAVAVGAFGVYFAFFAGPDLSQSAENDYVIINYPGDWQHQAVQDRYNTIIFSTGDLSPAGIDPWTVLTNTGAQRYDTDQARYDLQYWTFYFEWGRNDSFNEFGVSGFNPTMLFQRLRSDELAIAVFQAIPGSEARGATGADYARAMSQWFKVNLETSNVQRGMLQTEVHTSIRDISIDGHAGKFTTIQFQSQTIGEDSFEALYIATVTVDDIDYLLLFNGLERGRDDWEETAFAMAESMELKRP
jgi:hypothetical protein